MLKTVKPGKKLVASPLLSSQLPTQTHLYLPILDCLHRSLASVTLLHFLCLVCLTRLCDLRLGSYSLPACDRWNHHLTVLSVTHFITGHEHR